ncbi:Asp-tRNA(Asn)/Glu-tRNA(Gln) amidotransferase subunit GatC [Thiotrichales bacterium 19S11-10]|nr:Asp-tRNA(Asn)/Glu-tRNA(Gln) amidotransferase subunit GatC [Thiotrichales bacterium 19S11-10]MCF6808205.1 Asp-tRNA(Asn)/Glu-tRNA(Gln) amidotransferase subunit GatC [Thiotrichales bacterium 19S9-11]MCF6812221.1 Asp-tRNA(Asn)/Glu-tRNA(Gln) amidotransferase subunit GatC [Thiotrichales bacterium 19S9-12]
MSIDIKTVQHVANLARLDISDNDATKLADELSNILSLIDTMSTEDTDSTTPMAHPFDVSQFMREDSVTEIDQREAFQEIAPSTEAGLYLVPKVIE